MCTGEDNSCLFYLYLGQLKACKIISLYCINQYNVRKMSGQNLTEMPMELRYSTFSYRHNFIIRSADIQITCTVVNVNTFTHSLIPELFKKGITRNN